MKKQQYLKKVEEIANKEIQILNTHLSNCFKRFAKEIFKLNEALNKNKVIILDDNPLSLSLYAEEYPENFNEIFGEAIDE